MFCKKCALKNFAKFTGLHLGESLFFNKNNELISKNSKNNKNKEIYQHEHDFSIINYLAKSRTYWHNI